MSDAWQAVDAWLNSNRRVGRWRQQAVVVMKREVEAYRNTHVDLNATEILKLVDEAYPFGPRSHHPYDAWLTERKILRGVLGLIEKLPEPNGEDYAACEVAIDLVEQGQVDAARMLMEAQAPRRLNRSCPVCGVKPGQACLEPWSSNMCVVPHLSRVDPRRVNGPLFGGAP